MKTDTGALSGKRVMILGYGSQGRAQALNLRDSGVNVRVCVRRGKSAKQAQVDGFDLVPVENCTEAEVLQFLLPDVVQPKFYLEYVLPHLQGQTLMFAHGFNIHFGLIKPPADCDVSLVAPKAPGRMVRSTFEAGFGTPCLVAVHQDASGKAMQTTVSFARALGAARAGIIATTFKEETETDLFGEQAVLCGGTTELVVAAFETLVSAGYQPEIAYFECLHELKLIVDLLYEGGLARMHESISDTATYGALTRGPRVVDQHVRANMKQLLAEIRDGSFAREWVAEVRAGMPRFKELMQKDLEHPLEKVGKKLRSLMEKPK